MEDERRVLIVKGKAGLGNRLLSVLGGILYCQLYDRRLCVDWSDGAYAPKGVDAFPMAFRCEFPTVPLSSVVTESDVHPALWHNNLSRTVTDLIDEFHPKYWDNEMAVFSKYSIYFRDVCPTNKVVVRWSYHDDMGEFFPRLGMKRFTERSRFDVLQNTCRRFLRFENGLLGESKAEFDQHFSEKTIGIHVRYTDNKTPLHALLAQLARLSRIESNAKIFLATDNATIEQKLHALYPGRIVTTNKLELQSGAPLHRRGRADEARQSALLDMYLLSRCNYLIYSSRSTFGYCAALMSDQPVANLINCLTVWQQVKTALNSMKWNALRYS